MKRSAIVTAMVLSLVAGHAHSASVSLTFDDVACHNGTSPGPTNVGCTNGLPVGSDYGSTTGLTVFFVPGATTGPGQTASQFGSTGDFGVVELGNSAPGPLSRIVFTPTPGYEVSLVSFARRRGTSTLNNANFSLLDPQGLAAFALDVGNNPLEKVIVPVNSAFYAGPITFRYGSTGGATRIDDILLEVREIPEPATCAMLLACGLAFGARRRR
ncbi:MAG: PEP-CTERM sorting domain-containing protein [Lacipirellulaceae bacterium]